MTGRQVTWDSPISLADWNQGRVAISNLRVCGPWVYWTELRFEEAGRHVLMRSTLDGPPEEMLGPQIQVRSDVYEYGGGAYAVSDRGVSVVDGGDQRIYHQAHGGELRPVTEVDPGGSARFGDLDTRGGIVVAVRERAGDPEPEHDVVLIDINDGVVQSLASGRDFYAAPRIHPDGRRVCFLAWDHPYMPWDAAELHEVDLESGDVAYLAGGPDQSIIQPSYTGPGDLAFLDDRSGYWNLRIRRGNDIAVQPPIAADLAPAPWFLGGSSYAITMDGHLVAATQGQRPRIVSWDPGSGEVTDLKHPLDCVSELAAGPGGTLLALGAIDKQPEAIHVLQVPPTRVQRQLATTRPTVPPAAGLSSPEPVTMRARDGQHIFALYFPPAATLATDMPPPMIVNCHGGPTYAAVIPLDYRVQFWTSRGFAVLDVDYRGSCGRGRAYRDALYGEWGRLDVTDCVDAAKHLVARGLADPGRLVVRGESSGGYTALCAAAYEDLFAVVVAHYPVTDPLSQALTTHKFESRYVGRLIGDRPPRSPLADVARIRSKLLVTHGALDPVVPPAQTSALAEAARRHGVPVRHLEIPGERHGYGSARSIRTVREAELSAYQDWLFT
jgi:dipeptidyl aminopeptidase/acylaminoacyl peptidase